MPTKFLSQHGMENHEPNDFCINHFFTKTKSNTQSDWSTFQEEYQEMGLIYFEEPKGIHNYVKNIGSDPKGIETEIREAIQLYKYIGNTKIEIDYVEN
ncbi:MAG: hypothetical protein OCD76_21475 [Reichenbachiella sp.]